MDDKDKDEKNAMLVIQTLAQHEEAVVRAVKAKFDDSQYEVYAPKIAKPFSKKEKDSEGKESRKWYKKLNLWLPGYCLVETADRCVIEFASELGKFLNRLDGAVGIVHYGDNSGNILVREFERTLIKSLMDENHCVDVSKGERFAPGDKVKFVEGPLVGMEGMIKKVLDNKHKAILDFVFMGEKREMTVMVDVEMMVKSP